MKQRFTRVNNGHTLAIVVDKSYILSILDDYIKICNQVKDEAKKDPEMDIRESLCDAEIPVQRVNEDYGYYDTEVTFDVVDSIIAEYQKAKDAVEEYIADDAAKLWSEVSYKKNGTFKKNVKPLIFKHSYGDYWEDSYGWKTMVIRLEACSDTECKLKMENIIIHY